MPGEERFRNLFLLLVVAAISALFVAMIRGFLTTLLIAAIFAGLARPLYLQIQRGLGGRQALSAVLTILALLLGVFGPVVSLFIVVVNQALQFASSVGPTLAAYMKDPQPLAQRVAAIPGFDRLQPFIPQIAERSAEIATKIAGLIAGWVTDATSLTVVLIFDFVIMLYAMFFFLKDGPHFLHSVLAYLPYTEEDSERVLNRFLSVTRATLKGTLFVGAIQGTINGCAFAIVGLPAPAFWGAVMIVLSLVPAIGGALVWAPAAIWLAVTRQWWQVIVLLIICGGISGTVDNLLRPRLVGRDTRMPDLLILISTLGGIGFFGVVGFIVGPLVAALFLTAWEMLGEVYRPS